MAQAVPSGQPTILIHPTTSFWADVDNLSNVLASRADDVFMKLVLALRDLRGYQRDGSLPIEPYGWYGDSYAFRFCDEYVFTFKLVTDRDDKKAPIVQHYHLKNLLRAH